MLQSSHYTLHPRITKNTPSLLAKTKSCSQRGTLDLIKGSEMKCEAAIQLKGGEHKNERRQTDRLGRQAGRQTRDGVTNEGSSE